MAIPSRLCPAGANRSGHNIYRPVVVPAGDGVVFGGVWLQIATQISVTDGSALAIVG